jgi:hypothetical protein
MIALIADKNKDSQIDDSQNNKTDNETAVLMVAQVNLQGL